MTWSGVPKTLMEVIFIKLLECTCSPHVKSEFTMKSDILKQFLWHISRIIVHAKQQYRCKEVTGVCFYNHLQWLQTQLNKS